MNDELSHIRNLYSNTEAQQEPVKPKEEPKVVPVNPNERILVTPGLTKDGERLDEEQKFVDYQKYGELRKPYSPENKDDVKKEVSSAKKGKKKVNSNVRVISDEEFGASDYPSSTIMYYQKDHILTDIDNNIIDNPINIVGDLNLDNEFNNITGVLLYTRNDEFEIDYEIELVADKSWKDVATADQKAMFLDINHDEPVDED